MSDITSLPVIEMFQKSGSIFTISFYKAFVLTFMLDISLEITITGSGSSFPHEVYKLWQSSYITFRKNYVTLEMQYHAIGGTVAENQLYENKNIQYASLETVTSKNEQSQHLDIVEFPVVAGYVISVLFRARYSHNASLWASSKTYKFLKKLYWPWTNSLDSPLVLINTYLQSIPESAKLFRFIYFLGIKRK